MRIALLTTLAILVSGTGLLFAEEDGLDYVRVDVSTLVQAHAHRLPTELGRSSPDEPGDWGNLEVPEPQPHFPMDALVELIRFNIDPDSWESVDGASIEARGRWIHLRNRPEVVTKTKAFLYQLRLEAEQRVLLSLQVTEGNGAVFPAMSDPRRVKDTSSASLVYGVQRTIEHTGRVRYIADYDVEIAQGSNISDPITISADEGFSASFVATPTIDGERVVLEGFIQNAKYREPRVATLGVDEEYMPQPYRTDHRQSYGRLELPIYDHAQAHFTVVVPAARGTATVPLRLGGRQLNVKLDVRRRGERPPLPIYDLSSLACSPMPIVMGKFEDSNLPASSLAPRVRFTSRDKWPTYAHAEEILEEIRSAVNPAYWEEKGDMFLFDRGRIHVRADDTQKAAVKTFLQRIESQAIVPVVVDMRVWSQQGAVTAGPTDAYSREGARLVAATQMPTLLGRTAAVMIGSTANYIADYDVEVAQEARVADPIIGQGFDGFVANLRPEMSNERGGMNLSLQMLVAGRTIDERGYDSGTRFLGPVDKVREDRRVVNTNLAIPAGKAYVIDLGVDPKDSLRRLAGEIRVERR